jgi:hypothetical protein
MFEEARLFCKHRAAVDVELQVEFAVGHRVFVSSGGNQRTKRDFTFPRRTVYLIESRVFFCSFFFFSFPLIPETDA